MKPLLVLELDPRDLLIASRLLSGMSLESDLQALPRIISRARQITLDRENDLLHKIHAEVV